MAKQERTPQEQGGSQESEIKLGDEELGRRIEEIILAVGTYGVEIPEDGDWRKAISTKIDGLKNTDPGRELLNQFYAELHVIFGLLDIKNPNDRSKYVQEHKLEHLFRE